jgi:hypothetical protein
MCYKVLQGLISYVHRSACPTTVRSQGGAGQLGEERPDSQSHWMARRDLTVDGEDFEGSGRGSRFYPLLYLLTRVLGARDLGPACR